MLNEDKVLNALRACRDQLKQAIADRDRAWLALARLATINGLKPVDFQRLARCACPCDPWDLRIALEPGVRETSA